MNKVQPGASVYPTQRQPLQQRIAALLQHADGPAEVGTPLAIIVPDANRMSGGAVAAAVYQTLRDDYFETVILIAPSHEGAFQRLTICSLDHYQTPLGEIKVNDAVRNELCDEDDDIFLDDRGHFHPDGIDVQLPFLQTVLGTFDIVPIVMGEESPALCKELGSAVGEVMYNRPTLLVACANILDADDEALAQFKAYFEAGDVSRLLSLLNSETVRMEGKGAVLVALMAALHRRANHLEVLRLTAPEDNQPGYVGAILSRR